MEIYLGRFKFVSQLSVWGLVCGLSIDQTNVQCNCSYVIILPFISTDNLYKVNLNKKNKNEIDFWV